jgi:hypothetical protein
MTAITRMMYDVQSSGFDQSNRNHECTNFIFVIRTRNYIGMNTRPYRQQKLLLMQSLKMIEEAANSYLR